MKIKKVLVNDKMQKKYQYEITEPMGKNFDPEFRPDLTPKEMLEMGVFGGLYFSDKPKEFPRAWFTKAKLSKDHKRHKELNFFQVNASQPLAVWQKNMWINKQDPRGWMQWYFRYYLGRRSPDDTRQIKRFKAMTRHVAQITNKCRKGDFSCNTRQRQALLHWAYDSRKF
ncbi:MAG: hypothetical protein NTW98_00760 [Candidatus Nomurabacteria bacterium]|nr:hypothetical protein [Candidatus Nomurabacteria bacterium]